MKSFKEQLLVVRHNLPKGQPSSSDASGISDFELKKSQGPKNQKEDFKTEIVADKNRNGRVERANSYGQLKMKERAQKIVEDEGLGWDAALAAAKERRARADAALKKPKRIYSKGKPKTKVKKSKAERRQKKAERKAKKGNKKANTYKWRAVQGGAPGLGKR
jgi:hypothetical protein